MSENIVVDAPARSGATSGHPSGTAGLSGGSVVDPRRWLALTVIAIAQLMVVLDATVVNIALPSAQQALHISDANRQWIVTAYTLAFGGLLLLGGRVADYMGRKRAFLIGLIGFAGASALGGAANGAVMLFMARGLQGAFGALLAPAALSLLTTTFTEARERAKAFGVFGAISGGGAAIGLISGGLLTEYLNWRWCLFVNIPVAVIAFVAALPIVRESKAEGNTRYDVPGAVLSTLGLVSLVYGFTKAATEPNHWAAGATLLFLGLAVVLLTAFVVWETRTANPLLPMRVLLHRNRGGAYLTSILLGSGMLGMFLFMTYYLQQTLHYTALQTTHATVRPARDDGDRRDLRDRRDVLAHAAGPGLVVRHGDPAGVHRDEHRHGPGVRAAEQRRAARRGQPRRRCGERDGEHDATDRRLTGHGPAEHDLHHGVDGVRRNARCERPERGARPDSRLQRGIPGERVADGGQRGRGAAVHP